MVTSYELFREVFERSLTKFGIPSILGWILVFSLGYALFNSRVAGNAAINK